MNTKNSKYIHMFKILVVLSWILFSGFIETASAGIVEPGMNSNPCSYRLMDFESGNDGDPIASTIPGLQFRNTDGNDWIIGDFATGSYNGPWPFGIYISDGLKWAWLGPYQSWGRIDFTYGTASYFSLLTSTESGLTLEALNANGDILDSAVTGPNADTGWMTRLTVNVSSTEISYIRIYDNGNLFLVDDICTDAPDKPVTVPEFPVIALPVISVIGLMLFFQRRRYK